MRHRMAFDVRTDVVDRWHSFIGDGYREDQLNIAAQCPEEDKLIQGEVLRSHRGLELFYSRSLLPMRGALATDGHHAQGLHALALLLTDMCPNSYDWLNHLLDEYPSHVVEFTTLRYPWGALPNHNTLIWEVRSY